MKAVAVALLLANLLLFGWLYSHPQAYRPSIVTETKAFPAPVEPLLLLRERSTMAKTHSVETSPPRAQESAPEPPISAEVPPALNNAATTADASDPSPIREDTSATEEISPAAPQSGGPAAEITPERICQTIGPFPSRTQVDEFVSQVATLGGEPVVRASQIEQPSGYWVYLPAMPHTEARHIIDELSARGVKDYFLGRQNFISLGVFSDKRSAEIRFRDIQALGYAPRLEPRFLTREVFWVDLEERAAQSIDAAQWNVVLKERADIRRQSVTCE